MIIFTPNTVIKSADVNLNIDSIKNYLYNIKPIDSNFTVAGVRFTTTSASWVDITNCSFNYTSGSLTETLILNWDIMANVSGNVGETRCTINGVAVGRSLYHDASSSWVRAGTGFTYNMPANTTYTIKLQAMISGGSTLSITNESAMWKPVITGIAIPTGAI